MFCDTGEEAHELMRQACFDYLKIGGWFSRGPMEMLGGLAPRPYFLVLHFFAVAVYGTFSLQVPRPSLRYGSPLAPLASRSPHRRCGTASLAPLGPRSPHPRCRIVSPRRFRLQVPDLQLYLTRLGTPGTHPLYAHTRQPLFLWRVLMHNSSSGFRVLGLTFNLAGGPAPSDKEESSRGAISVYRLPIGASEADVAGIHEYLQA